MKMFIVFAAIIALTVAAPADYNDISVVKAAIDHIDTTGYKFEYEQSDGVVRTEEGVLKNAGTEQEALEVRGSVTWTAADGQVYTLNFVADENGYRPEGAHIPHL
ncbi:Endocuticle structural protein SgAbd-6 [Pseudolycoriella hygida]|uniref:Endocuticle structural protein SgAbd-6 n=1 Tax=Pseudolycoriella hygida TaxID=35572 RepID=A0A9Q0MXJ3_9DIPT|nr:Endocuticle structural protein SgAbd-6 [Pseudolycoriella hygida]